MADHQVLEHSFKEAKVIVQAEADGDEDLARLLQLAAAGHEGVDLGELTDEELDAWIKRH